MRWTALILVILVAAWPSSAYAYLDPSTTGVFLQIVFGGIAIVLVAVKLSWNYLASTFFSFIGLFSRSTPKHTNDTDLSEPEE